MKQKKMIAFMFNYDRSFLFFFAQVNEQKGQKKMNENIPLQPSWLDCILKPIKRFTTGPQHCPHLYWSRNKQEVHWQHNHGPRVFNSLVIFSLPVPSVCVCVCLWGIGGGGKPSHDSLTRPTSWKITQPSIHLLTHFPPEFNHSCDIYKCACKLTS